MLGALACVYVQFIFAPFESEELVCLFTHDPVVFVAKVALILCPVFGSFTVPPTAICRFCPVVPLVGCGPVTVGLVFVVV